MTYRSFCKTEKGQVDTNCLLYTSIVIDKPGLKVAGGAIGIGEITSIPTAPAIADAYFRYDHERRYELPLKNTPYERKW